MRERITVRPSALPVLALALAGCGGPKQVTADHAWVRLAAVPRQPAAAYFTVHGGPADATLIAVSADVAIKTEMHASMATGGMARMTPLASVPVPARADVPFAPGGRHVMLFDVNPGIKPGKIVTLNLGFADGKRLFLKATAVAAGDPPPKE